MSSWGLFVSAASGLAIIEANLFASSAAATAIALVPVSLSSFRRAALFVIAGSVLLAGPTALLLAVPAAMLLGKLPGTAAVMALALTSAALLDHHFQSIPRVSILSIHLGSAVFVLIPSLVAAVSFGLQIGWRAVAFLFVAAIAVLFVIDVSAGNWVTSATFTSPLFRTFAALIPAVATIFWVRLRRRHNTERGGQWMLGGATLGVALSLLIPDAPIKSIVFDESHGEWETVDSTFAPDDFGRGVNYTYSLLAGYGEKIVGTMATFSSEDAELAATDALFVLKMPTVPLSNNFSDRLERWVRDGGRLLVVADHTDLYDTTQNLNEFLSIRFGLAINSDAVFDPSGMPNVTRSRRFAAVTGRIDGNNQTVAWQTGTSLAALPPNTVELATFGPSFSEPGDYSGPNRFGSFFPRPSIRFGSHSSVVAFGAGNGAIAIMLDSTPWSNFSIFKEQYKHLFRGIVYALSRPAVLQIWGWSGLCLIIITLMVAFSRHPVPMGIGGLALGLTIGAASQIGIASFDRTEESRDYELRVVVGETAKLEFLQQLVGPGERNFSRIISAMSKYGLNPSASAPGQTLHKYENPKRILLIQPDAKQLPDYLEVASHLRGGGDLTILFAPEQAAQQEVLSWLNSLGLFVQKVTALALTEDARPGQVGILNRRGAALMRDVRAYTGALPTSLFLAWDMDQLVQSYTVRPTLFPRTSGLLSVGFSADQFSDAAVGEVWEGVQPSSLGRLRERQLAAVINGQPSPAPFPNELSIPSLSSEPINLFSYLLAEDGQTVLQGKFVASIDYGEVTSMPSPIDDPVEYLHQLRGRAVYFVETSCPPMARTTVCQNRMLGPDGIEWMVSWVSEEDGAVAAIELLHERSFSDIGRTLNVVFGN